METDHEKHAPSGNRDDHHLERLGYAQEVKRNFSLTAMVATCVSLMATWEALCSTMVSGLVSGGPVSLVYGAIAAFIGSLCSALSLAELASSHATAGGQYHFVAKLCPKRIRPVSSWLAGYISTLGWIAVAGSAPFLAGTQIQGMLVLNYTTSYTSERWHGTLLYWSILIGSAGICILCSNILPLVEKVTMALHIIFFIIILVVMVVVSPTKHSASFVFTDFQNNSGWASDGIAWCIGLLSSCYVLIGYDGATHLSEEMERAEMGVPRAMVGSILINGTLGFGFLVALLFCMGDIESALNTPTGFPIIQIFYNITGSIAAATALTSAVTIMAALSTVPLITSAARLMWAFARDQGLPFSTHLSKIDRKRQIPTIAILTTTVLLMLLGLINIGSTTAFNAVLSLAVVSLQISYLMPIILLIWRRISRPNTLAWGPWKLGKLGIVVNIVAIVYLIFTSIFLIFPPYQPITAENMNYAPVVLGGAAGCAVCKRRKLKCDEALPGCRRCSKSGIECPGYARSVKWSTKHERNLRLSSSPGSTWFEREADRLSRSIAQGSPPRVQPGHEEDDLHEFSPDASDLTFDSGWSLSLLAPGLDTNDQPQLTLDAPTLDSPVHDLDQPTNQIRYEESLSVEPNDNEKQLSNTLVASSNSDLSLYVPAGEPSMLLSHYFSFVCEVASSFDSSNNPFRSRVTRMMDASPLLFTCVMSISAAHLYQNQGDSSSIPLSFQTEAISRISGEVAKIKTNMPPYPPDELALVRPRAGSLVKDDVLLGIILLGMTSSWHDPSSLGLCHLTGSRHLFKLWMATNGLEERLKPLSMTQNFIVSSMVYWEVMVSFLLDQDMEEISYLDAFLDPALGSLSQPCPWTGVATDIFIRLAKVGTMVRKRRMLRNRELAGDGTTALSQLIDKASALEQDILKSRAPLIGLVKDTGDPRSPPSHLVKMARSYRLASLLELYQAFPEIATNSTNEFGETDKQSQLVLGLAFDILEILETIPDNSRTIAIQSLVYLIAGSTLGHFVAADGHQLTVTQIRQNQLINSWRQFVRNRFYKSFLSIGLHTINRVGTMLEEVWSRMDSMISSMGQGHVMDVYWIDVMIEKKLETILG